jgi:ABC-type glucose/galactose transport system permease subunit
MTKQEVATLSFRIASLYVLVQCVQTLSVAGYYISTSPQGEGGTALVRLSTILLGSVFLAAVSWYLWVRAARLSKALFPIEGVGAVSSSSPSELQEVAYRILGLYMLFWGFTRLSSLAVSIFARSRVYPTGSQLSPDTWGNAAAMIVQFVLGIWLILGAPKLDELLKIIRREDDEVEDEPKV